MLFYDFILYRITYTIFYFTLNCMLGYIELFGSFHNNFFLHNLNKMNKKKQLL